MYLIQRKYSSNGGREKACMFDGIFLLVIEERGGTGTVRRNNVCICRLREARDGEICQNYIILGLVCLEHRVRLWLFPIKSWSFILTNGHCRIRARSLSIETSSNVVLIRWIGNHFYLSKCDYWLTRHSVRRISRLSPHWSLGNLSSGWVMKPGSGRVEELNEKKQINKKWQRQRQRWLIPGRRRNFINRQRSCGKSTMTLCLSRLTLRQKRWERKRSREDDTIYPWMDTRVRTGLVDGSVVMCSLLLAQGLQGDWGVRTVYFRKNKREVPPPLPLPTDKYGYFRIIFVLKILL